jgi:hypothetical protein
MSDKDCANSFLERLKVEAEKEGKEPSMKKIPDSERKNLNPTTESLEKMGKRIASGRDANPSNNPFWVEYRGNDRY